MNTVTVNNDKYMHFDNLKQGLLLGITYAVNAAVWLTKVMLAIKVFLLVLAGLTTVMTFLITWANFEKKFKTIWLIVKINHVITTIVPRQRKGRRLIKPKKQSDDISIDQ